MSNIWIIYQLFGLIVASVMAYWFYWRWRNRRMLQLASQIPGPPALPVLGNALKFMTRPEELLDIVSDMVAKYGDYFRFWLGPELNICVTNPADIRFLLTSNKVNVKGPSYEYLTNFIGRGILTGGSTWRHYRKIANPAYSKKSVQSYTKVFNEECEELAKLLSRKDPGKTFDVYYDVVRCTTQCVCQTLMGLSKKDTQDIKNLDQVVDVTPSIYHHIFSRISRWWLQIPIIYWLSGLKKKELYYKKLIDEMMIDIVEKRKRAMKESGGITLSGPDQFLLNGLSDEDVKLETFSIFTTSQEASAKIASAVLLILAYLPEWQDKVYEEIVSILGPEDGTISDEQLKKLSYLNMVYKEALRYLSIAALIQRTVEEEITINDGNITLPVGTTLVIPIHVLHRDCRYWDEPLKIKPERFLPENVKKRDPNAFVPFSLGAMDCLGRVYATTLIKTLVVRVLRHVQLETDDRFEDLEIFVAISVKLAKGYNLRARPRNMDGFITNFRL